MSDPYDSLFKIEQQKYGSITFNPTSCTVFQLREEHVRLIAQLVFYWSDHEQSPQISSNRPYGNSGVLDDIAEIVGVIYDPEEGLSKEQAEQLLQYHMEVVVALQIIAQTGKMEPGLYTRVAPWTNWFATTEEELQRIQQEKQRRELASVRRWLLQTLTQEDEA